MEVKRYDMIVVGAGPAGLSAAIEAAKHGVKPIVFDENARPGGQLFKQIHKFFGSKEHKAKIRGFKIGEELLEEAEKYGVEVVLNATVVGLYPDKEVTVRIEGEIKHFKGDSILIATGASENMVNFKGLDASWCDRCRRCTDNDEPSSYLTRQANPDAWFRKCWSGCQLSVDAGRLRSCSTL